MKLYRNNDTGEVFAEDELKVLWKQFGHEMKFDSFEDFKDSLEEVEQKWYAVLRDADDNDWETGSYDFETAKKMLLDAGYDDGRIAVIEMGNDPVCVEVLTRDDMGI